MSHRITQAETPYKEVRGLVRGLDVLTALNAEPGGLASTSRLAAVCALDRTTTKRLLETLSSYGLVRPGEREGQYQLTFEVRRLSEGYADEAWIERVALPLMREAVPQLLWPCDLGLPERGFMVIRQSTHRWSALSQHRAMIGQRMPVFVSALGRAYLAACDEAAREALLQLLAQRTDAIGAAARDVGYVQRLIEQTLARGYAVNDGEWDAQARFAAIAVPLRSGQRLLGALNMVFPRGAVTERDVTERWLPRLRALAEAIDLDSRASFDLP